jgi:hypothetical protein
VQALSSDLSRIDVRYVGGLKVGGPNIDVFIDGECAGGIYAPNYPVQACFVAPGVHAVHVTCNSWRSAAVAFSLSTGECAALECDFAKPSIGDTCWWLAVNSAYLVPIFLGLYLTALATSGLTLVLIFSDFRQKRKTPGAFLYLTRGSIALIGPATGRFMARPRVTLRRAMALVALIAALLAVAVHERRLQRRAEMATRSDQYLSLAKGHADQERFWTEREAQQAVIERLSRERVENLLRLNSSQPGKESVILALDEAKRELDSARAQRAMLAQRAAAEASLKQKYVDAALRP